jgi:hypothetical protein
MANASPEQPEFLSENRLGSRNPAFDFAQSAGHFPHCGPIFFLRILIAPLLALRFLGPVERAGSTAERMRRQP